MPAPPSVDDYIDTTMGAHGLWLLNETAGTTATNLGTLGAARNGTYVGTITRGVANRLAPGTFGANFDTAGERVTLGSQLLAGQVSSWFLALVRTTATTGFRTIYAERRTAGDAPIYKVEMVTPVTAFGTNAADIGKLLFTYRDDAAVLNQFKGEAKINDGRWHLVAVLKFANVIDLYVDGVLVGTNVLTASDNLTGAIQSWIGSDPFGGAETWAGDLNRVALWTGGSISRPQFAAYMATLWETIARSRIPALTLELALNGGPFATPVWTDFSSRFTGEFETWRGRAWLTDKDDTGAATFELNNDDLALDPANTGGPHYGNLVAKRRVRLRSSYYSPTVEGLQTSDAWTGFAYAYQQVRRGNGRICRLRCYGSRWLASDIPLADTPYEAEVRADAPVGWWPLNEAANEDVVRDRVGTFDGRIRGADRGGPQLVPYHAGASMFFEHIGSGVIIDALGLITAYPFTLAGWVRLPNVDRTSFRQIVDLGDHDDVAAYQHVELFVPDVGAFAAADAGHFMGQVSNGANFRERRDLTRDADNNVDYHLMLVAASSTSLELYVNGVAATTGTNLSNPTLPTDLDRLVFGNFHPGPGGDFGLIGYMAEWQAFRSALSSARAAAHYNAGALGWAGDLTGARLNRLLGFATWPGGLTATIDAGNTRLQGTAVIGGSLLDHLDKIAATELGRIIEEASGALSFRQRHRLITETAVAAVFSDTPTEGVNIGYEEAEQLDWGGRLINAARVGRRGGVPQVVKDQASIDAYGFQPYDLLDGEHENDNLARAQAEFLVQTYAQPRTDFRHVTIAPAVGDPDMTVQAFTRRLDERIQVEKHNPKTGALVGTATCLIQGIRHRGSKGKIRTSFALAVAPPSRNYVIFNDATRGQMSSGNLLAY